MIINNSIYTNHPLTTNRGVGDMSFEITEILLIFLQITDLLATFFMKTGFFSVTWLKYRILRKIDSNYRFAVPKLDNYWTSSYRTILPQSTFFCKWYINISLIYGHRFFLSSPVTKISYLLDLFPKFREALQIEIKQLLYIIETDWDIIIILIRRTQLNHLSKILRTHSIV